MKLRLLIAFTVIAPILAAASPAKVLIVDGQNNHAWQETTPALKNILEATGLFRVDVATSPAQGKDMAAFRPQFAAYAVVLSNYNGDSWPAETNAAFEKYVREGGGFVVYHAADNAFPGWKEYNEMIAIGGWGDRTEQHGPRVFWSDGKPVLDDSPGKGGHHGKRHQFLVVNRDTSHPVTAGLAKEWMHNIDELYDSLRGPAGNMDILSTAFSELQTGGTGKDEPLLLTVRYGKGRIFHTALGHDLEAMKCVGFITTLQRGAEWAATGKVTQKAPPDFPSKSAVSLR